MVFNDSKVKSKFDSYPDDIRPALEHIRKLIFDTANEYDIGELTETLKWGEPSYLCSKGSTVRLGWRAKFPKQYGIFFHCQTTLIETFKEIYGDLFYYEGNRGIIFELTDEVPAVELKHCISLSLQYHNVKHLPLLGSHGV